MLITFEGTVRLFYPSLLRYFSGRPALLGTVWNGGHGIPYYFFQLCVRSFVLLTRGAVSTSTTVSESSRRAARTALAVMTAHLPGHNVAAVAPVGPTGVSPPVFLTRLPWRYCLLRRSR